MKDINAVYKGKVNNAQGRLFEMRIIAACDYYRQHKRADIHKTPEPFQCVHKTGRKFTGVFTAKAQPDFCGTLMGGASIVFEAKYTTKDRIEKNVLSQKQVEVLELSSAMNAFTFVCFGIKDKSFMLPYELWRDMKANFNKCYLTVSDIQKYRVCEDLNCTLFLNWKDGGERV